LGLGESPKGRIGGWVNYSTDLYEDHTILRLVALFEGLLERVTTRVEARLDELEELLTQAEREQRNMERIRRQATGLQALKQVQPRSVTLPSTELVRMGSLAPGQRLPLLIEPALEGVDGVEWARANRALIGEKLVEHGGILFRGFGIHTAARFEPFAAAVCDRLFNENGEHPRQSVSGNVYTPVLFPKDQKLLMHNENSFNRRWPRKILFCCAQPAGQGGETPIVDSRQVFRRLAPELLRSFLDHGVCYLRNYHPDGVGLAWQAVYQTADRREVERICEGDGVRHEWLAGDRLRTLAIRPAAIRHPATGEAVWFNQAQHWHVGCLEPQTRRSLLSLYAAADLPRDCRYGDGGAIPDEVMREILRVYDQLEVSFPWQGGDVLLLDNLLTAHGRNPFVGERKLLVAMGEMTGYDEVQWVGAEAL
jgi:alpha-ketoglutarate-dependent taurine dioxygenase